MVSLANAIPFFPVPGTDTSILYLGYPGERKTIDLSDFRTCVQVAGRGARGFMRHHNPSDIAPASLRECQQGKALVAFDTPSIGDHFTVKILIDVWYGLLPAAQNEGFNYEANLRIYNENDLVGAGGMESIVEPFETAK